LIFTAPLYGKVLRGEKTQTRRLVQPKDLGTKYRPGMRRAVQKGRGIHGEAHILLTDVRRELLGAIDFNAARAEGFRTTEDFKSYWIWLHDTAWADRTDEECCDIYTASPEDTKSPSELMAARINDRFYQRWALKEVWVLSFELDRTERPRLLADRNAKTDYVDAPARALDHEPEAVDIATQLRFSREGHQGFMAREAQRELDRERMAADERLRQVQIDARAKGVDISHLEASIVRQLRAAERKVHQRKAA
jgi:hypothetical protein